MKIAVLDITSRNADQYNPALCNALSLIERNVTLIAPMHKPEKQSYVFFKLFELVPRSWSYNTTTTKRILRAIEIVINYLVVWFFLLVKRPNILHVQWLPFLEHSSLEQMVFRIYRFTSGKTRFFLTVHNVFPHNFHENKKQAYIERFKKIDRYFDGYMVHLDSNKNELMRIYGIHPEKIHLAFHGIYYPLGYKPSCNFVDDGKLHIVLFGIQSKYKGADILVDAMRLLPAEYLQKVDVKILGKTSSDLKDLAAQDLSSLHVSWNPNFVSDEELYAAIGESNLIILPYRAISQSGVLLLALSYRKSILTSDLPSFMETLKGYNSDWFFKSENPSSLANLIMRYVDKKIDIHAQVKIIDHLNQLYSWEETAKSTINAYKSVIV